MLFLLARSGWSAATGNCAVEDRPEPKSKSKSGTIEIAEAGQGSHRDGLLLRLALPQLALVVLALTTIHVQIITRLSSGYPVWYFVLARDIMEGPTTTRSSGERKWWHMSSYALASWTVRWMVMYALIQGVLFASFLPPA